MNIYNDLHNSVHSIIPEFSLYLIQPVNQGKRDSHYLVHCNYPKMPYAAIRK